MPRRLSVGGRSCGCALVCRLRVAQIAGRGGRQLQQRGQHAGPVPQQGRVIGGQADAVAVHLPGEAVDLPAVVVARQRGRL